MPLLNINSLDRDMPDTVYDSVAPSTPEDYTITLAQPITSAVSVDLMHAIVPKSMLPLVAGYNMRIQFSQNGTSYDEQLFSGVSGVYTPAAIVAEVATAINAAVPGAVSTAYDADDNTWTLTELLSQPFRFIVHTIEPATAGMLGISAPTAVFDASTALIGGIIGSIDLSQPKQLKMDMWVQNRQTDQAESKYNRFSYIMPMYAQFGDHAVYRMNDDFPQAGPLRSIGSIDRIRIRWSYTDPVYDGLLDFQGANHTLQFSVRKA